MTVVFFLALFAPLVLGEYCYCYAQSSSMSRILNWEFEVSSCSDCNGDGCTAHRPKSKERQVWSTSGSSCSSSAVSFNGANGACRRACASRVISRPCSARARARRQVLGRRQHCAVRRVDVLLPDGRVPALGLHGRRHDGHDRGRRQQVLVVQPKGVGHLQAGQGRQLVLRGKATFFFEKKVTRTDSHASSFR